MLNATCGNCGDFIYENTEIYFDENGYGYSTKLVKCPSCGRPVVIGHYEDRAMKKLNKDNRYYDYGQKTFLK